MYDKTLNVVLPLSIMICTIRNKRNDSISTGIYREVEYTWKIENHIVADITAPVNNEDTNARDLEK